MNPGHTAKLKTLEPKFLYELYCHEGSIQGVLRKVGINSTSKFVSRCCTEIIENCKPGSVKRRAVRNAYSVEDIKTAVKQSKCMSDVLKLIKLSTHGTNAVTIKKLMLSNDIDFSHFDVIGSMQRNKHRWSVEDIFKENSPITRPSLRRNVLKYKVLEYKCNVCGNEGEHIGQPLSLTVDHINGISNDNRVENLRWLCPNCHSQTENYCGKNKRTTRLTEMD